MGLLDTLFSNLRILFNDTLMPARPNLRIKTTAIPVTDEPSFDATQIDFVTLEGTVSSTSTDLAQAEADIIVLQDQIATADPGGAAARYVWQPGGTTSGSTFTDFEALIVQALVSGHLVEVVLDDSAGALAVPGLQVDLGGRIRLFADHDVTLIFGNNAELLDSAGTRTEGDATIETDITGALGGEPWSYSGSFPATRIPTFKNTTYTLTTGSRRFMDLTAITAVNFDGGDITDLICGTLTCEVKGGSTFAADPFIASGDVTVNYADRTQGPTAVASVTGTFLETNLYDSDSAYVELVFQPGGSVSPGTFTTLADLQVGITAEVNAGNHGKVVLDGSSNSGLIELDFTLSLSAVFEVRVLDSVDDVQFTLPIVDATKFLCDQPTLIRSVGDASSRWPLQYVNSTVQTSLDVTNVRFEAQSSTPHQFMLVFDNTNITTINLDSCTIAEGLSIFIDHKVASNLELNTINMHLHHKFVQDDEDNLHLSINTDDPNAQAQISWNNTGATQSLNIRGNAGPLGDDNTPEGLYSFDGDGQKDKSGNGRVGVLQGSLTTAPGHFKGSVAMGTMSDSPRLVVDDAAFKTRTGAWTLEAVVYIADTSAVRIIASNGHSSSGTSADNNNFVLFVDASDVLRVSHEFGSGSSESVTGFAVPVETWVHITAKCASNGRTITGYINGVEVFQEILANAATGGGDNKLTIGGYHDAATDDFNGLINDFAIYPSELAAVSIFDHAQRAMGAFGAGTFTPTWTFVTPGDFDPVYTTQLGTYRVTDNVCHFTVFIQGDPTHTTASGAFRIQGLPFPAAGVSSVLVALPLNMTDVSYAFWNAGESFVGLYKTSTSDAVDESDIATGVTTRVILTGSFLI